MNRRLLIGVAIVMVAAGTFRTGPICQAAPSDCETNDCTAPDKWFAGNKTPKVVFADFPKVDDDECAFYRWAWQSFLYLTQSDQQGGPPRFVLFHNENELFDTADNRSLQVAAAPIRGAGGRHVLSLSVRNSPRTLRDISAKAFQQAGSQGVVVDHNNRCLYYGMHFNDDFVDFIKNKLGLRRAEEIANVPITEEFPVGSVELKSAWRVLTDQEKLPGNIGTVRKNWFVINAEVPTLFEVEVSGVKIVKADPTKPRSETVALVGLHVVGVTPGHHEFVWASFEHAENSPTPSKSMIQPDDPVSNKDFTFYKNGIKHKDVNINPVDDGNTTPPVPLKLVSADKQTLAPVVEVCREFNSGEDGVSLDDDVCTLNTSARTKLAAIPELAVWSNYQLIGAVWLKNPVTDFKPETRFTMPPVDPPGAGTTPPVTVFAGEIRLSNSVMETFTQRKTAQVNCFGCHDTAKEAENGKQIPGLKIKVSHGIRNAFFGPEP